MLKWYVLCFQKGQIDVYKGEMKYLKQNKEKAAQVSYIIRVWHKLLKLYGLSIIIKSYFLKLFMVNCTSIVLFEFRLEET